MPEISNDNKKEFLEYRNTVGTIEYREEREKEGKKLRGYAARFNEIANLYWFDEEILPGAFRDTIKNDDIRALVDHVSSQILGRNRAKPTPTLELFEDKKGLGVTIDPPDTRTGQDIIISVDRGDVTQMSFSFRANEEIWIDGKKRGKGKNDLRQIKDATVRDVSIVTFPAYESTEIKYRSIEERSIENIYASRCIHIGPNPHHYMRYLTHLSAGKQ